MDSLSSNPPDLTLGELLALAKPLGFALVGVAPADPSAHAEHVRSWLAADRHGEMRYLAEHVEQRLDPRALLPGAKSILCVADIHPQTMPEEAVGGVEALGGPLGRIARYTWGDDYHKVIKKRLFQLADALRARFPDEAFKAAVDTAPILEREHAARAGLGWVGKHTLLIHPGLGSYFLLGEIVTTLDIETSEAAEYRGDLVPPTDHCGACTRCIDACPTHCITPYEIDAARCISYLTLEHRSAIAPDLHEGMGDWIAGCDVCQEVCPHNRPRPRPRKGGDLPGSAFLSEYTPRPPAPGIDLLSLLGWTEEDRRRAFKRSALKRIKLDMLLRNALIAAGNALERGNHPALRAEVERLAKDPAAQAMVRDTAQEVLRRLHSRGATVEH